MRLRIIFALMVGAWAVVTLAAIFGLGSVVAWIGREHGLLPAFGTFCAILFVVVFVIAYHSAEDR